MARLRRGDRGLRVLAAALKVIAGLVVLLTLVLVVALVGTGASVAPGLAPWLVWLATAGTVLIAALAGLAFAALCYGLGGLIEVLLDLRQQILSALAARQGDDCSKREKGDV